MSIILLIRHGQTAWNAARRWQGHSNIPLNEKGQEQASLLARRLATWPIKAVYSSDLQRAMDTAQPLAARLGLELQVRTGWRERNAGLFEGLTLAEIEVQFPDHIESLRTWNLSPPQGENNGVLLARAQETYAQLLMDHPQQMVVVISHGGVITTLISHLIGVPAANPKRLAVSHTGISRLEVGERGTYLTLLNDTSHLSSGNPGSPGL